MKDRTVINVPKTTKEKLDKLRVSKWEPYYSIIERLIEHYEKTKIQ